MKKEVSEVTATPQRTAVQGYVRTRDVAAREARPSSLCVSDAGYAHPSHAGRGRETTQ